MHAELPANEQDLLDRRERAVRLVAQGRTMSEAATIVGLHRKTVSRAVRLHADGGQASLVPRRPGRKPLLSEAQHQRLAEIVTTHRPDEVGLRGRYWTKAIAVELIERETGVRLGDVRAGIYLNRWGAERLRGRPAASRQVTGGA